jgi:hypothetical protein
MLAPEVLYKLRSLPRSLDSAFKVPPSVSFYLMLGTISQYPAQENLSISKAIRARAVSETRPQVSYTLQQELECVKMA